MPKPVVLFDLDYTLIDADCELVWCDHLFSLGIVDEAFMRRIDQFDEDYAAGHLDYPSFDRTLLSPVAQFSVSEIKLLLADFMKLLEPRLRPWMLQRIDEHRRDGQVVVLATASNSFLAEPIAARLGFDHLICTPAEVIAGKPTGAIIGRAAFREGKVERLHAWLAEHSSSLSGSWAYSDSHNDLPLLSAVEHPVAVTPDEALRLHAGANGWAILESPNGHFSTA
jgi:HAD superfamily hydrolase (TIGR01490 family)